MCKQYVSISIILTFFCACATMNSATSVNSSIPKIVPKFDYIPKKTEKIGSANITIALVKPLYVEAALITPPFDEMKKNMANDFEELLTSKGFKVRGPFDQVGDMLYNDKQNSDFIFLVDIDFNFKNINRTAKKQEDFNWAIAALEVAASSRGRGGNHNQLIYYTYSGEGTIICTLTITATSSKFGEKIWKKNITLPARTFKYVGTRKWKHEDASLYDEMLEDNVVFNEVASTLEKQYQAILDLVEKQIEVAEMKTVKTEANKIDGKN